MEKYLNTHTTSQIIVSSQTKANSSVLSSNQMQEYDETYIDAAGNEYVEDQFYESVAKPSVKVHIYQG